LLLTAVVLGIVLGIGRWAFTSYRSAASAEPPSGPAEASTNLNVSAATAPESNAGSSVREPKGGEGASARQGGTGDHALGNPSDAGGREPSKPSDAGGRGSSTLREPVSYDPGVAKARQVLLANRRIVVASGRSFPTAFCTTQTPTTRGTAPYVVISELPVGRDARIQAVADGARVIGYLPNNALLVEADAQALKNLQEDVLFMAAVEYEPTDKIQQALLGVDDATVEATVMLLNPTDHAGVRAFIEANGGTALGGMPASDKVISATLPRALVGQLAGKAEVKWIERFGRLKALNDLSVLPACMNVTPVWNLHGLDGTGEVITIDDTGLDQGSTTTIHADFKGKIKKLVDISGSYKSVTYDANGHGTHVAGSAVGSGAASDGQYAGVAKGAKLYFQSGGGGSSTGSVSFGGVSSVYDIFAPSGLSYGNYVTSISLGNYSSAAYTYFCQVTDETMWKYPELLVVIANGNSGSGARTVYEPAAAKNCLSVGNTCSTRGGADPMLIAGNSSRGPCADGRIKPEVAAPGVNIISTRSGKASGSGDYTTMSGTSMATPHVSGAAAIVRQWLRRDRGYDNATRKPTGALMKAILTGGANGGIKPDNDFGWGRVDLEATIFPTGGLGVYLRDRLPFAAGESFVFRVTTTNAAPLDVQLVWTDCPAETSAAVALLNNLDLSVSSAADGTRQTWLGNGGTEPDDVNTVESVRIRDAKAGRYTITVSCPKIVEDHTRGGAAALYVRGAFDERDVQYGKAGMLLFAR